MIETWNFYQRYVLIEDKDSSNSSLATLQSLHLVYVTDQSVKQAYSGLQNVCQLCDNQFICG